MPASEINKFNPFDTEPAPLPPQIKGSFTEQQNSKIIPLSDEYETWVAEIMHGLWLTSGADGITVEKLNTTFGSRIPLNRLYKILGSETFHARMHARGINWLSNWTPERHEIMRTMQRLTPQQALAVQIMTDPTDRRSTKAKLDTIGISYNVWRTWQREPFFAQILKDTAELLLQDNLATIHSRLVQKAEAGDTNAIKLFYEVSGRHDPNRQQMLDFGKVVALILESLQRHVTDAQTLLKVTTDLDRIMSGKNIVNDELTPNVTEDELELTEVEPGFFDNTTPEDT